MNILKSLKLTRALWKISAIASVTVLVTTVTVTSAQAAALSSDDTTKADFTIQRYLSGEYDSKPEQRSLKVDSTDASLRLLLSDRTTGEDAIVDTSLADAVEPAMWAATPEYVDLSWTALDTASEYAISKNGQEPVIVSEISYRDTHVIPGETINYRIEALHDSPESEGGIWGLVAQVPNGTDETLARDLNAQLQAMASYTYATVQHQTFIPQARIDAPSVGCTYGSGYEFNGSARGYGASLSPYKTSLQARANFSGSGTVTVEAKKIGTTYVYKKSTGAQVASKTASSSGLTVERMAASSATSVDMRFSVNAANPFCSVGSISAKFTITVTKTGSWYIITGTHKQMPNHEVYIHSNAGGWVTAYQRNYLNSLCLIGTAACANASMAGYGGTY